MNRRERGFTLIEIGVSLALLALVLGLSAPALERLYERLRFDTELRELQDGIAALPRLAWAHGLEGSLAELAADGLEVPEGWVLVGADRIFVRRNGLCAGGELRVVGRNTERQLRLLPPFCTVERLP